MPEPSAQQQFWIKRYYLSDPEGAVSLPDWIADTMLEAGLVVRAGTRDRYWLSQGGRAALNAMLPVIGGHIIP